MRLQRFCLLVYDSRSGSTYFSRKLDRLRGVAVSVESYLLKEVLQNKKKISVLSPPETYRFLHGRGRISSLGVSEESFLRYFKTLETYGLVERVVRAFYCSHLESRDLDDVDFLVVKDGANGFYLNLIAEELPQIKVIFLVRDGRAVLNSKMNTPKVYETGRYMARDPITAARIWTSLIDAVSHFSEANEGSSLTVRYEDLISSEDAQMQKVTRFLGCSNTQEDHSDYFDAIPEGEKAIHQKVRGPGDQSRAHAWRSELPEPDRIIFEKRAATALEALGYNDILEFGEWESSTFDVRLLEGRAVAKRVGDWLAYLGDLRKLKKILSDKVHQYRNKKNSIHE